MSPPPKIVARTLLILKSLCALDGWQSSSTVFIEPEEDAEPLVFPADCTSRADNGSAKAVDSKRRYTLFICFFSNAS